MRENYLSPNAVNISPDIVELKEKIKKEIAQTFMV